MAYVSLYRKWRPQGFVDVVGQDSIVKTLENSLNIGRISHAYLFSGPRGTGKTTVARILAKGLNCLKGPTSTPCGECVECEMITAGTSLNVIEIDGASNRGIEDVRELRSQVQFTPVNASYKVYIIDEVHMLTTEAFNALLKTLEEPPPHVVFIFATTDPHRLPATILSRVQRYDFGRFSEQALMSRLTAVSQGEDIKVESEALRLIAKHAAGGMRDAIGILEKCSAFAENVTIDAVVEVLGIAPQEQVDSFAKYILADTKQEALQIIDALYNHGRDLNQFALEVVAKLRQYILSGEKQQDEPKCLAAIEQLTETVREMRFAPDPRITLELAVLKITTNSPSEPRGDVSMLEEKILTLEKQISKLRMQLVKGNPISGEGSRPTVSKPQPPSANDVERSAFVLEVWADYLKGLRDERLVQCEAFLKEGVPVEVVDDHVLIAFPRDRGFHKASIEQDSHREPAERVLSKLMGMQVRFKCVFQDEVASVPKQVNGAKREPKSKQEQVSKPTVKPKVVSNEVEGSADEFLKASMETFGGKIISKPKEN